MASGKVDPKIGAAIAQQRADFDAAVGRFEMSFEIMRNDFRAASQIYNEQIKAIHEYMAMISERVKKLEDMRKLNA